jgi:protein SCO1/2
VVRRTLDGVLRDAITRARWALLALAAGALLAGCGSAGVAAPGQNLGTRVDTAVPRSLLQLPLRDQDGRVRHLAEFAGKVLVVSDAMTLCQETCPLDTAELVQTARQVDAAGRGKDVAFLSITVDPERDTPARLAAYRGLFHHPPANWTLLTGSAADVHRLWKWFGVYWHKVPQKERRRPRDWLTGKPLTYDVTHSDEVFFLRNGRERFVIEGMPHLASGSEIPRRIYRFMSAEGRHNVAHPHPYSWTSAQAARVVRWLLG